MTIENQSGTYNLYTVAEVFDKDADAATVGTHCFRVTVDGLDDGGTTLTLKLYREGRIINGGGEPITVDGSSAVEFTVMYPVALVGTENVTATLGSSNAADTSITVLVEPSQQVDITTQVAALAVDTLTEAGGDGDAAAILADTNELQGDLADGGRLDLLIDAIKTATGGRLDLLIDSGERLTAARAQVLTDLADGGRLDLLIDSAVANTGQGARTVTITVDDGTNSLENAMVRLTSGAESYNGATNASGVVTLQVDDATWDIDITHTLHTFTSTTLVVDGNKAETYSMTAVALAASDVDKTTGYTYTLNSSGVATQGIAVDIQAAYSGQWSAAGVAHAGTSRSETSDADGLVEFTNLVQGGEYDISSVSGETIRVTVPTDAGATYQLPTVVGGTGA